MDHTENATEIPAYVTPAVADLGSATEATLGHAGGNNADDTQYFSNW
ncbi:hypothetical protein ACFC51_32980 [Streptomyces sp. NPDC055962]